MSVTAPRFVRHWKEHFSLDQRMIFIKRLRLGLAFKPFAEPGDEVTQEIRDALGSHRLKVWWWARVIGSRDYAIKIGLIRDDPAAEAQAKEVPPKEPEVVPVVTEIPLAERVRQIAKNKFEVRLKSGQIQTILGSFDKALKVAQD